MRGSEVRVRCSGFGVGGFIPILISLGQCEIDWQMKFSVVNCHYETDSASASQPNTFLLFTTQSNFGKYSEKCLGIAITGSMNPDHPISEISSKAT